MALEIGEPILASDVNVPDLKCFYNSHVWKKNDIPFVNDSKDWEDIYYIGPYAQIKIDSGTVSMPNGYVRAYEYNTSTDAWDYITEVHSNTILYLDNDGNDTFKKIKIKAHYVDEFGGNDALCYFSVYHYNRGIAGRNIKVLTPDHSGYVNMAITLGLANQCRLGV